MCTIASLPQWKIFIPQMWLKMQFLTNQFVIPYAWHARAQHYFLWHNVKSKGFVRLCNMSGVAPDPPVPPALAPCIFITVAYTSEKNNSKKIIFAPKRKSYIQSIYCQIGYTNSASCRNGCYCTNTRCPIYPLPENGARQMRKINQFS